MKLFISGCLFLIAVSGAAGQTSREGIPDPQQTTICNPLNLNYRFCPNLPSRREAADPAVVTFKEEYYLFASKSGGYWHSADLINWDFITSSDLPFEDYAPAAVVINDMVYFMASGPAPGKIFKTSNPKSGKWEVANAEFPIAMVDPDFFLDEDGRLYFYYGCSNVNPIYGVELDIKTLNPIGNPVECFNSNKKYFGWEQNGDYNNLSLDPWIEGAWMTKHNGLYYLQYAAPGTEYKSYCDGLYVSEKPLGPFRLAETNPCSYKPGGFIAGAGHSTTFQDKYGNYWHVVTMTISQKHAFERRLGLFPMFFDKDGTLYTYTGLGDFPMTIPSKKISGPEDLFPQWMILSYNKPVQVSSELPEHPKSLANDEEVRTYWSAVTGDPGEWVSIDLKKSCRINAVQVNFAEHNTKILGRDDKIYHSYLLEYSDDGVSWHVLKDKSQNQTDVPHDYIEFSKPVNARFIRLKNVYVPDGTFAISDLRVFGSGQGNKPSKPVKFSVVRTENDNREVKLKWDKIPDVTGYIIRYGTQPDKLYLNFEVLDSDTLTIRSLNALQKYYFSIDAFNENGVATSGEVIEK